MGLRETINEKPGAAAGVCVGLILCGLIVAYLYSGGSGGRPTEAFFTIDDGKTWFADSVSKLPPFDHDGKQAVRAYVFECNGKTFVNSLERLTPAGKQAASTISTYGGATSVAKGSKTPVTLTEVKRPGGAAWVSQTDYGKSGPVLAVKCPDGDAGTPTLVEP